MKRPTKESRPFDRSSFVLTCGALLLSFLLSSCAGPAGRHMRREDRRWDRRDHRYDRQEDRSDRLHYYGL